MDLYVKCSTLQIFSIGLCGLDSLEVENWAVASRVKRVREVKRVIIM